MKAELPSPGGSRRMTEGIMGIIVVKVFSLFRIPVTTPCFTNVPVRPAIEVPTICSVFRYGGEGFGVPTLNLYCKVGPLRMVSNVTSAKPLMKLMLPVSRGHTPSSTTILVMVSTTCSYCSTIDTFNVT